MGNQTSAGSGDHESRRGQACRDARDRLGATHLFSQRLNVNQRRALVSTDPDVIGCVEDVKNAD